MKHMIFFAVLVSSLSSWADSQMLVAVHGKAQASPLGDVLIEGQTVSANNIVGVERANQVSSFGFAAILPKELNIGDANCKDGVYVVTAGKGNFLPNDDRSEVYFAPKIVSFVCINK